MEAFVDRIIGLKTIPAELTALPNIPVDARVVDWFGTSYEFGAFVVVGYLLLVFLLWKWTETFAAPWELYHFRVVHNLGMFLLSLYMFIGIMKEGLMLGFFVPVDRSERTIPMANLIWLFYMSKIIEFNDTFIMLLRKKYDQVTFLHVYHHASVFFIWLLNVRLYPGSYAGAAAAANSFIHVVMYGYYLLSTFNIHPWWKKYLTQMQLAQFIFMVCEGLYLTLYEDKEYRIVGSLNGIYAVTLYCLFLGFYNSAYKGKGKGKAAGAEPDAKSSAASKTRSSKKDL